MLLEVPDHLRPTAETWALAAPGSVFEQLRQESTRAEQLRQDLEALRSERFRLRSDLSALRQEVTAERAAAEQHLAAVRLRPEQQVADAAFLHASSRSSYWRCF